MNLEELIVKEIFNKDENQILYKLDSVLSGLGSNKNVLEFAVEKLTQYKTDNEEYYAENKKQIKDFLSKHYLVCWLNSTITKEEHVKVKKMFAAYKPIERYHLNKKVIQDLGNEYAFSFTEKQRFSIAIKAMEQKDSIPMLDYVKSAEELDIEQIEQMKKVLRYSASDNLLNIVGEIYKKCPKHFNDTLDMDNLVTYEDVLNGDTEEVQEFTKIYTNYLKNKRLGTEIDVFGHLASLYLTDKKTFICSIGEALNEDDGYPEEKITRIKNNINNMLEILKLDVHKIFNDMKIPVSSSGSDGIVEAIRHVLDNKTQYQSMRKNHSYYTLEYCEQEMKEFLTAYNYCNLKGILDNKDVVQNKRIKI